MDHNYNYNLEVGQISFKKPTLKPSIAQLCGLDEQQQNYIKTNS